MAARERDPKTWAEFRRCFAEETEQHAGEWGVAVFLVLIGCGLILVLTLLFG